MPFKTSRVGDALLAEYRQDPQALMALQAMQQGSSTAPVYSPLEGVARALQGGVGGYFAGQRLRDYEGKQADQYGAIADILAPKVEAQMVKTDMGPLGTLDASTPEMANPNREKIMGALQSGLLTPSAVAPSVMDALGFGKSAEPIKVGKNDRLYAPGQYEKPLVDAAPEPVDYNKPFNADGTPNLAYQEYTRRNARESAPKTSVNVGPNGIDYGKPEEGLVWKRDQSGKVLLDDRGAPIAVPYQGGKAFIAQKERDDAERNRTIIQRIASDVVVQDADKILSTAEGGTPVAGFQGNLLKSVPGTPQRDVAGLVETIKSNVGFDKLQAMRQASPTGGALGNVSEKELRSLQATIGDLEQSQSQEQFVRNVKRVRDQYIDTVHGAGTAKRLETERASRKPNNNGPKAGALSPAEQAELAELRKRFGSGK